MPWGDVANGQAPAAGGGGGGWGSLTGPAAAPAAAGKPQSGLDSVLGKIGHVLEKTTTGLASDAYHAPGAIAQIAKTDVVVPWKNFITTGHPYQKGAGDKMDKLNDAMVEQTLRSMTDPAYMYQHPDQVLLNLLPATHAIGSVAARGGAAVDAARAAEGGSIVDRAGAAAKAAAKKPEVQPRLIQVGDKPLTLHPSTSPAVRAAQGVHDALLRRALESNPDGKIAGYATRRLGGGGAETRRYQGAMRNAPAQLLNHTGNALDDVEQAALRLTSEQTLPEEAIQLHQQQLEAGVNPAAQAKQIKLLTQVRERGIIRHDPTAPEGQQVQIDPAYAAAKNGVRAKLTGGLLGRRPDVAGVDAQLAAGGAQRDKILTDTGQMTDAGIKERVDAPNRIVAGARYESPTPAKQGVVSPIMQRELDKLEQLQTQRDKLQEAEANHHQQAQDRNLGPLSEPDAQARLAGLDATYDELVKTLIPETSNYGGKLSQAEQLKRNFENSRAGKGKRIGVKVKQTVKSEEYRNAEAALHDVVANNADHPIAQRAASLIGERQRLRDALNARAEHQMGIGEGVTVPPPTHQGMMPYERIAQLKAAGIPEQTAEMISHDEIAVSGYTRDVAEATADKARALAQEHLDQATRRLEARKASLNERPPLPDAPARIHNVPPAANPYTDAITTTQTLLDAQKARVAKMLRAAAAREKPTGIVGGEDARAGRNYVPYYKTEPKAASAAASRAPSGVMGRVARIVPRNKAFTGEAKLQAEIPDNTTGLVARQMERAYKYLNNDQFRRDISTAGSDTRQTRRDVLVNTQELLPVPRSKAELADAKLNPEKYAQPVPDEIRAMLGDKRMTLDELVGHAHGFEAWRQQLLPGLSKGSDAAAIEKSAGIGTQAPGGYKWVDRNLLAELGKPGMAPSGRITKAIDTTNAAQTAATVYFKIGHVATRAGTNAVAALVQGSLNPVAMTKAYNLWGDLTPLERVRALAGAGEGGIHAMPAEAMNTVGRVARGGALWWSKHFDAPFRFLSLAYEARKAGYGELGKFRQLLDMGEDPASHGLNAADAAKVDWIFKRANREAIAYDRLNEFERRYVRRAIWFYPWIKGASQFGLNTMLEHPYKAAGLGQLGSEGTREQQNDLGPLPSYERGLFKIGGTTDMPLVGNVGTVSPYETPGEVLESVAHLNKPTESERLSAYLTPALAAAARVAFNLDSNGRPVESRYGQPAKNAGVLHNLLAGFGESTPEIALYKALTATPDSQAGKMFPNDARLGLLRFFLGTVVPRPMNKGVANEAAMRDRAGAGR